MSKRRLIHVVAVTALAAAAAMAPAQERGLKRLVSGGDDGNTRNYVARCLDGTVGTVKIAHDTAQICAVAQGGQQTCRRNWALMAAGQAACGAAGPR